MSEDVSGAHGSILTQDVNTPNTGEQAGAEAVTAAQAQLGGYAMEMLTACDGPFALGMLVQGTRLTLWCFQRSIAVRSMQLDLTGDTAVLGLFLVQILCAQNMFLDASAILQKQVQSLECEATISTAGLSENEYRFERSDREARTVLSVSDNIVKVFAQRIVEDVTAAERFELLGLGTDMFRVPHLSLLEEYAPIWNLKDETKFWDVVVQLCNCASFISALPDML